MTTPTVLEKIIAEKRKHIAAQRVHRQMDPKALQRPSSVRGFSDALKAKQALGLPAVIAEIKKGSPSKALSAPILTSHRLPRLMNVTALLACLV